MPKLPPMTHSGKSYQLLREACDAIEEELRADWRDYDGFDDKMLSKHLKHKHKLLRRIEKHLESGRG